MAILSFVACWRSPTHLERLQDNLRQATAPLGGVVAELVVENDSACLAAAYNRALARARGEWVVFVHDDVVFLRADCVPRLLKHLEQHAVVGIVGTTKMVSGTWHDAGPPYLYGQVCRPSVPTLGPGMIVQLFSAPLPVVTGMAAVDGFCVGFRKSVIDALRFDEAAFPGWDGCATEASYRAHLAGHSVAVACDVPVLHMMHGGMEEPRASQRRAAAEAFGRKHGLKREHFFEWQASMTKVRDAGIAMTLMNAAWSPPSSHAG